MKEQETFYMVFVEGGNRPAYKHQTIEAATNEAIRLMKITDRQATVLCSIKTIAPVPEYQVIDNRPNDDLPF